MLLFTHINVIDISQIETKKVAGVKQFGIRRRSVGRVRNIVLLSVIALAAVSLPVGQALAESANEGTWTTADINVNGSSAGWSNVASSDDGMKLIASNWNTNAVQTSSNGGVSWTTHTLGRWQFNAVASSADGTKLFAAGASIFASTDGGVSWAEHTSTTGGSSWLSIASSADGTKLVAGKYGYVYTSTDSGATWTEHASVGSGYWSEVASSADGTKLVAAEVYGGDNNGGAIYTSTDSGATWTERPALGRRIWDGVAISADGSKLAASVNYDSANDAGGYIYTSTDGGAIWTERTSAGVRYWNGIALSADGSKLVATDGDSGNIYTSTDSGATWTERSFPDPCNWGSVVSSADGSKILAACNYYGPLYSSVDSGATWTKVDSIQSPKNQWRSLSSSADGTKLIAGGLGNNGAGDYVRISNDSGTTWTKQQGLGVGYWSAVAYSADGTHMAAADPYGPNGDGTGGYLYTSSNGGASWIKQTSLGLRYWTNIKMSFNGAKIIAATDKAVYVSYNNGVTWAERTPATGLNSWWSSVAMSMDGSKLFAVDNHGSDSDYDGGSMYVSSDGGVSWAEVTALGKGHWTDMDVSTDGTKIAVSEYYHSIYTSTDDGATWTERKPIDVQLGWARVASSADGQKLIATPNNFNFPPYVSADGGATWFPLNTLGVTDNYDGWGPVASSYDGRKVAIAAYTGSIRLGTFPYPVVEPVFPVAPPAFDEPSPIASPVAPSPGPVVSPPSKIIQGQSKGLNLQSRMNTGNGDTEPADTPAATPKVYELDTVQAFRSGKGQAFKMQQGYVAVFRASGEQHTVTVDAVGPDFAALTLRSTPQRVTLKVGQTGKYDVNEDGKPDISVSLHDIANGVADLSFAAIASPVSTHASSTATPIAKNSHGTVPAVLTGVAVVAVAVVGILILRRIRR